MKKMKVIYILSAVVLLFMFSSCEDFLTENPKTFVSPANFYKSADDAALAMTGVYSTLQSDRMFQQSGWGYYFGNMGTDLEIIPPWGYDELGNYSGFNPEYSYCYKNWAQFYNAIQKANVVIKHVTDMDDELFEDLQYGDEIINQKTVILGEAYFVRALVYFHAEMYFGNIPLVLDETSGFDDVNVFQNTPQEVYTQILADLTTAETSLPWVQFDGGYGHATKGAAKALLGKVYLQMGGFPLYQDKSALAAQKLKEVIDQGIYSLMPIYGDVFGWDNKSSNTEMIYAVKYATGIGEGSNTGSFQGIMLDPGGLAEGGGYENTYCSLQFAYSFDSSDVRFWWNCSNRGPRGNLNDNKFWTPWKWHKANPNTWGGGDTPFDWPVLRYGEVLLMYAEALNASNDSPTDEAYWAINQLRQRARLTQDAADKANPDWLSTLMNERLTAHPTDENVLPDLEGLTKEEFLEALLQEQAWELCWEGQRKPALIRTGKLQEYITEPHYEPQMYNYHPGLRFDPAVHYWFPIPQRDMDLNPNLVQNPGY